MSNYTDSNETVNASFHPTNKFSLNVNQNYTNNLTGYLAQSLSTNGAPAARAGSGIGIVFLHYGRRSDL